VKAFVSYRHTGADEAEFRPQLDTVMAALREVGVEPLCTLFDATAQQAPPEQFMREAFDMIDGCAFLFVLQSSAERSEGMLMEVGYCLAKRIPIVVASHSGITSTYVPGMAQVTFEWANLEELAAQTSQVVQALADRGAQL
jgi:nucleoside 2-deoxyribosyltransferase